MEKIGICPGKFKIDTQKITVWKCISVQTMANLGGIYVKFQGCTFLQRPARIQAAVADAPPVELAEALPALQAWMQSEIT